MDIRASKSNTFYLFHGNHFGYEFALDGTFANATDETLCSLTRINGEPLLPLTEALDFYAEEVRHGNPQILCLDIKDYGMEAQLLEMVRARDLEDHIIFVSWIPQSLTDLAKLGARTPLFFSHLNISCLGEMGRQFATSCANSEIEIGHLAFMGATSSLEELAPSLQRDHQHGWLMYRLPQPLMETLAQSKGGICVPTFSVNETLLDECRENGLRLWVFSAKTPKQYTKFASMDEIDGVFYDGALPVGSPLAD